MGDDFSSLAGGFFSNFDDNVDTILLVVLRWLHVFFGIVWIGHLYFFNFVNVPFGKTMDADTKKKVVPQLMPRALWWFRWGAMFTLLFGLAYIAYKYFLAKNAKSDDLFTQPPGHWILFGGGLGIVMWFNVWFIIWPCQKKIISAMLAGQPVPPNLPKTALTVSRLNTFLSVPMLFGMVGSQHLPMFDLGYVLAASAVGLLIVYCAIQMSNKAGSTL